MAWPGLCVTVRSGILHLRFVSVIGGNGGRCCRVLDLWCQNTTLGLKSPFNPPFKSSATIRVCWIFMSLPAYPIGSTPNTAILALVQVKTPQSLLFDCCGPVPKLTVGKAHSSSLKSFPSSALSQPLVLRMCGRAGPPRLSKYSMVRATGLTTSKLQ